MSDKLVKGKIDALFDELNAEVQKMARSSSSADSATLKITDYVSSKITASTKGYLATLYSELSKDTLSDSLFTSDVNANKFYELNMRQKIYDAYQFEISNLSTYSSGINAKEISRLYLAAGAAAGTMAVGGILKAVLSGVVTVPLVVIIAGAVLIGCGAYTKIAPALNKARYVQCVNAFMADLKNELLAWVDEVIAYYHEQTDILKKSL